MFSTAFTSVDSWGMTDMSEHHMSEHLQKCPYNDGGEVRKRYTQPVHLTGIECHHSSHFRKVMQRMYPGSEFGENVQESL